ncbi:3510_t:CDS:2 [Funneliformis geosporum]|nr:3510_t:CDS:2 [Funneliformis geosporum]
MTIYTKNSRPKPKIFLRKTFESDCKFDKHFKTYRPRGYMPENYKKISTDDRSEQFPSTYPPSKSESGGDAKERALGSWQLLGDEYMEHLSQMRPNMPILILTIDVGGSLPKLQDVPFQLLDQLKDELHDFTGKG